jgi:hypothetical protein
LGLPVEPEAQLPRLGPRGKVVAEQADSAVEIGVERVLGRRGSKSAILFDWFSLGHLQKTCPGITLK